MFIRIKKILFLCFITLAALITGCSISHKYVTSEKFEWYFQTRKIYRILVDTRNPGLYNKSHLKGAVNIPVLSEKFKESVKAAISPDVKDVWVVFVYAHDPESTEVLKHKLENIYRRHLPFSGPTAIFYLQGGYISLTADSGTGK